MTSLIILTNLLSGVLTNSVYNGLPSPAPQYPDQGGPYCNHATIVFPKDRRAVLRNGPGARRPVRGTILTGATVYTCDEQDRWVQVFYPSAGLPCKGGRPLGLPRKLSRFCQSGWIERRYVDTITG